MFIYYEEFFVFIILFIIIYNNIDTKDLFVFFFFENFTYLNGSKPVSACCMSGVCKSENPLDNIALSVSSKSFTCE